MPLSKKSASAKGGPRSFLASKLAQIQESAKKRVTERELKHLNSKVGKLLTKIDDAQVEPAASKIEECLVCTSAKSTMQTLPCGHCVVCRKCFIRSIQKAVAQRNLPLRCVMCKERILKLSQTFECSQEMRLPLSVSQYSMASSSGSVPDWDLASSASLHSVASDCSGNSGRSRASKSSIRSTGSSTSSKKRVTFASSSSSHDRYKPGMPSPLLDAGAAGDSELEKSSSSHQVLSRRSSISSKVSCMGEGRLSPIRESRNERCTSRNGSSSSSSRCSSSVASSQSSWRLSAKAPLADDETQNLLSPDDTDEIE